LAVTEDGDAASVVNPKPSMIVSLRVVRLRLVARIFARRVGGMHRLGG
jgi:hypothetical protein